MRNRILAGLAPEDRALLAPHLAPVELPTRHVFHPAAAEIREIFFLEDGLASVVASAGDRRIEVGMIGREGVAGAPALLGRDRTPHESFMQVGGAGHAIGREALREAMGRSATLAATLLGFVHAHMVQMAETALANGRCTVEQRLARWLLMAQDRLGRDEVELTHEYLALMLGVRRPGVTVALHVLEGERAVRSRRGVTVVMDREALRRIAGPAYSGPDGEVAGRA